MLVRKNHVAGTFYTLTHTVQSIWSAMWYRVVNEKWSKIDRKKAYISKPIFSPEGRGTKELSPSLHISSRRPRKPLDTRLHHIGSSAKLKEMAQTSRPILT